ncbi:hypothetical protein Tco_1135741 [Tanacetum coccineum]
MRKLKNKILVPMPESSQQHIKIERICFDCGDLLHGLNCLECDLTRKILEKAFQKFQNTSKSSNDNSNVVMLPREPFIVKQDPRFQFLTKILLLIDQNFDQFQPPQYTVYHQILNSQNEFFNSQNEQFNSGCEHLKTQITTLHDLIAQAMLTEKEEKRKFRKRSGERAYWKIPICDDDA